VGLGPRQEIRSPDDVERNAEAATALAADIASPADEAADAPGPKTHYRPPKRVQDTHALGGMDVLQDVYSVDGNGRRTRAGTRGLLGSADDPASLEGRGGRLLATALGTDWPAVRDDLLAALTLTSLQTNLKAMMVGEGIEIPLSHDRSIVVGAEITTMRHVRNTAKTEFNIGSDTTRTMLSSQGYDWRLEGAFNPGGSTRGPSITGTVQGEYGLSDNRMDEQTSIRSGSAVKVKTAGAVFDGVARLTFTLQKGPAGGTGPTQDRRRAYSEVGFQVVIEANDAEKVTKPTPFVATGARKAMTAPPVRSGETVRKPRAETWAGPWGRGGLPAGTVVLDVLAGTNANGEPVVHNPVAEVAGALGRRYVDRWEAMRPQVRAAFSRDRLAASLPAMTRGVPLKSGPLIRVGPLGYTQKPWRMSATARLRQLDFVREIGGDVELNVLNDVATRSTAQHTSYWGAGPEGQLSGGGDVAPGVRPTAISMSGSGSVGVIGRLREGTRAAAGSGTIASGKFPRPMVVYIATAAVHMDLLESGVGNPKGSQATRVQFLVAVPKSATTEHTVGDDGPSSFSSEPPALGIGTYAAAAPGGGLGPERVRREGRIGPTDVVVGLADGMAVVDAVKNQIGAHFGGDWPEAEAQLLPLFDAAALRPLAPALTQGRRWGTLVQVGKHKADVTIVSTRARMIQLTEQVPLFEFEIGTDSTSVAGSLTANRLRGTARLPEASITFPYLTLTCGVTHNWDRLREGVEDDSATAVSRGKPVEPATLYAGELTYRLQVALAGQQAQVVTATMRGEFAFPTRDVEPVPAPKRRPPSRITESHVLGESDIVGDLLPPLPQPATAAAAGAAAQQGGHAAPLTPRAIVDQLNTAGRRVYGDAWEAVSAALQDKLDIGELRTQLRSMMAGQAWTRDLGDRGTVSITASVATLAPVAPVNEAEFNSGASGGTVFTGTEAGPTDERRSAHAPSLGFTFTTNPSALRNGTVIGGYTQFYERGYDRTTDHGGTTQAGTGTKTKAKAVVFEGDLVLHFDFRPPRDRSPATPEVAAQALDRMRRIDDLRQEIADLDASRRQPPPGFRQAGESPRDTRERYITSRQARLDALLQRQFADVQERSRPAPTDGPQRNPHARAAEAKLRFTVLVEQPDTLQVTDPGDARFEAGKPVPDGVRQARLAARLQGFGNQLPRLPKDDVTTQGLKAHWVIRDVSDVGSLHKLLDDQGRQSYGNTWDAEPASGKRLSERVKASFGREKFMTVLARLTQGKTLDSEKFSVLGTTGWVSATAKVMTLAQGRDEKAEVTIVGETSARYRDRERTSHLLGGTGRGGGAATGEPGGLSGELLGTVSGRDREGGEAQSGGRVFANAKVPKDNIHFDGFVEIAFTFHPGTGSAEPARVAGIVLFIVAIPEKETVVFEQPRPRTLGHHADTGDAEMTAQQTAETIRGIEQHLRGAGVGAAALITAGGRRHVDVGLYRVDAVARDPHERGQTPRIEWRDARTRRLLHPRGTRDFSTSPGSSDQVPGRSPGRSVRSFPRGAPARPLRGRRGSGSSSY
jgi:hypothetical protein